MQPLHSYTTLGHATAGMEALEWKGRGHRGWPVGFWGGEMQADGVRLVQPLHSHTTLGHGMQHMDADVVEQRVTPVKSIGAAPALPVMTGLRGTPHVVIALRSPPPEGTCRCGHGEVNVATALIYYPWTGGIGTGREGDIRAGRSDVFRGRRQRTESRWCSHCTHLPPSVMGCNIWTQT